MTLTPMGDDEVFTRPSFGNPRDGTITWKLGIMSDRAKKRCDFCAIFACEAADEASLIRPTGVEFRGIWGGLDVEAAIAAV